MKSFLSTTIVPVIISGNKRDNSDTKLEVRASGGHRIQAQAPWQLARLNQEGKLLVNTKFNDDPNQLHWPYLFDIENMGQGSRIYIMDSGVRASHEEFLDEKKMTRVEKGNTFGNAIGPATEDVKNGHGTAVASLAAGSIYGAAKAATIVPYKVTHEGRIKYVNGDLPPLVDAIKAAREDFVNNKIQVGVINISNFILPMSKDLKEVRDEIKKAIDAGMHITISAGNERHDQCGELDEGDWIYVGATDINDEKLPESNFGKCVEIYAPGKDVYMAGNEGDKAFIFGSGTSFSAPLVAGVVAVIGASNPTLAKNPKKMKEHILEIAAKDKISNLPKGPQNRILQGPLQASIYQ